ncbi:MULTISPECIES: VOC family protein [Nocardioides]|uniref:VOC family protein n=1 Tax=Nocardioides vastitatis TaxID=2568655 RepID=A0ABW0ZIB5_9ACTN|nr:VOC family protein [Nocardioides sp.]THJ14730.1 glyoxalase [Nocardioides sp.]
MSPTLNSLDIIVADLPKSIEFYRHLGLELKVDPSMPDHASCDLPNGLHLMLDAETLTSAARPGWVRGAGSPPVFLCFGMDTAAEVDTQYARLVEAGYRGERQPWNAFWGMRYATVLDPDGNGVDLWAPLNTDDRGACQ